MQTIELNFEVQKPFSNLRRKQCVLIAAQDSKGRILVGAKSYFYPPTIFRLLGGGVDAGESFLQAAARELHEELDVEVEERHLTPLFLFKVHATDDVGREYHHETAVFHAPIGTQRYQAGDDVSDILAVSSDELFALGERYESLPPVLWYNGEEGQYAWADYAKFYGPLHKRVAERIRKGV